jgi:hypothetical protein
MSPEAKQIIKLLRSYRKNHPEALAEALGQFISELLDPDLQD